MSENRRKIDRFSAKKKTTEVAYSLMIYLEAILYIICSRREHSINKIITFY